LRSRKKAGQAETAAFFASDKNEHLLFVVFWSLTTRLSRHGAGRKKSLLFTARLFTAA
jgi:hypothetical protein